MITEFPDFSIVKCKKCNHLSNDLNMNSMYYSCKCKALYVHKHNQRHYILYKNTIGQIYISYNYYLVGSLRVEKPYYNLTKSIKPSFPFIVNNYIDSDYEFDKIDRLLPFL